MFTITLRDGVAPRTPAHPDGIDGVPIKGQGFTVWATAGVNYTVVRYHCPSRRSAAAVAREYRRRMYRRLSR